MDDPLPPKPQRLRLGLLNLGLGCLAGYIGVRLTLWTVKFWFAYEETFADGNHPDHAASAQQIPWIPTAIAAFLAVITFCLFANAVWYFFGWSFTDRQRVIR